MSALHPAGVFTLMLSANFRTEGQRLGVREDGFLSVAADPLTLDGEVSDRRGAAAERD